MHNIVDCSGDTGGYSVSILHLLFGFSGRISRKTYIIAVTLLAIVMSALMFSASVLAIGNWYFAPSRLEDVKIWLMIYGVMMLVGFWPTLALVTKRLHDRNYPMWVGLVFYFSMLIFVVPILWIYRLNPENIEIELLGLFEAYTLILVLLFWPLSFWLGAQLTFMRGVAGSNAWGPDPLEGRPLPGYERRTFWNVVFNPDGRMRRGMWWLMFGSLLVLFVVWGAIYGIGMRSAIPQGASPEWLKSAEGQRVVTNAALPIAIPLTLLFYLLIWAAFAAGTKRLHDRGRSGWVLASYYIPFALVIIGGALTPNSLHGGASSAELMRWLLISAGVIFAGLTLWLLVELGFLKGQAGANAYGPGPESETSTV